MPRSPNPTPQPERETGEGLTGKGSAVGVGGVMAVLWGARPPQRSWNCCPVTVGGAWDPLPAPPPEAPAPHWTFSA